jgi:hypothetical protein
MCTSRIKYSLRPTCHFCHYRVSLRTSREKGKKEYPPLFGRNSIDSVKFLPLPSLQFLRFHLLSRKHSLFWYLCGESSFDEYNLGRGAIRWKIAKFWIRSSNDYAVIKDTGWDRRVRSIPLLYWGSSSRWKTRNIGPRKDCPAYLISLLRLLPRLFDGCSNFRSLFISLRKLFGLAFFLLCKRCRMSLVLTLSVFRNPLTKRMLFS